MKFLIKIIYSLSTSLLFAISCFAQEAPPIQFTLRFHAIGQTLGEITVGQGAETRKVFVPNRGFSQPMDQVGLEPVLLRENSDSDSDFLRGSIAPLQAWDGKELFAFLSRSNEGKQLGVHLIILDEAEIAAGAVVFSNFSQTEIAVKLGDVPNRVASGQTVRSFPGSKNGAIETILFEMGEDGPDFLYRNFLRKRTEEVLFLFIYPQRGAPDELDMHTVKWNPR
ncbi:hypothetical protein ACWPKO_15910 [Coraliomargarita sp. W4R53]